VSPLRQGDPLRVLPSTLQFLTIPDPDMYVFAFCDQFPDLREMVLENRDYTEAQLHDVKRMCLFPLSELSE
jgi:hypothetical protein